MAPVSAYFARVRGAKVIGPAKQHGVSLIEVLVAALVFSFGMIGLAALLIMAARSNQSAYLRTQAIFLAQSMADRMRFNVIAVWHGQYNGSYPHTSTLRCDSARPCAPAELADYDKFIWSQQLTAFLPEAQATLACDGSQAGYDPVAAGKIGVRPPFGGNCKMTIAWEGRPIIGGTASASTQKLEWDFQP